MPLKVSDGIGSWIKDFQKSDAPQFKGKSDKDRRDQAIAAYLSAKRGKNEEVDLLQLPSQPLEEKVDRDALAKAMAVYKAKGGKVTKAPAAKAQGYHGKDDPGKGMHGMLDKPDTKKIGTRKKVKSMEGVEENYVVQKYTDGKKDGAPKSFGGNLKKATAHASKMGGDHRVHKEAKRTVTIDRPDRLTSMRVSKDKPPFDNAKPVNKDPKDKFGNPIKNRAKHLARQAARDLVNKQKDEGYVSHAQRKAVWASRNDAKKEGYYKDLEIKKQDKEMGAKPVPAKKKNVNELSPDTKKSYTKKATTDLYGRGLRKGMDIERGSSSLGRTKVVDKDNDRKISNRHAGIYRAQK